MFLFRVGLSCKLLLLCVLGVQVSSAQSRPDPNADFKLRCSAPGVIRCIGFDSEDVVKPHLNPAWDGVYRAEVDTTTKASGDGALRFTIPTRSPANTSGNFWLDFADDDSLQFGEGQEFYIQWRQRFSPEMLETNYKGGNGWKQVVIGEGDRPGHTANACTDIQIVVEDTYQVGAPRMYHSCGRKDGQFEPLQVFSQQQQSWFIQNALGCTNYKVTMPPCFRYVANQWMTFQMHVRVGSWYKNDKKYRHDSTIQLWVAQEGRPSKLVIDMNPEKGTGYDLVNVDPDAKYGKLWFLPYDTDKDASQDHPTAYTWYDELILSKAKISDPK